MPCIPGFERRGKPPPALELSLIEISATEAVDTMRRGDTTAEAYADALLAACEQGRQLNAFISLEPDLDHASARKADRRRAKGARLGLLHGLPVPVKDSLNTYGLPPWGPQRYVTSARRPAPCVTRLRTEGTRPRENEPARAFARLD